MLAYRNPSDRIPKGFRNTPKLCAYDITIPLDMEREISVSEPLETQFEKI